MYEEILICAADSAILLLFYNLFLQKKAGRTVTLSVLFLSFFSIWLIPPFVHHAYYFTNLCILLWDFFLAVFFYHGKLERKLGCAIGLSLVTAIADNFIAGIFVLFGVGLSEVLEESFYQIEAMYFSKLILFALFFLLRRASQLERESNCNYEFPILFVCVSGLLILSSILYHQQMSAPEYSAVILIELSFYVLVVTILMIHLIRNAKLYMMTHRQLSEVELQLKHQAEYFDHVEKTNREIAEMKHDLYSMLAGLELLIQDRRLIEAEQWIASVSQTLSASKITVRSGIVALDAVLESKDQKAAEQGIQMVWKTSVIGETQIDPVDLCILFANGLDNAIEACFRTREKRITVQIAADTHSFIGKIENSQRKQKKQPITKGKHHGYGLSIMKNVVEKYDGAFKIRQQDHLFQLTFILQSPSSPV